MSGSAAKIAPVPQFSYRHVMILNNAGITLGKVKKAWCRQAPGGTKN